MLGCGGRWTGRSHSEHDFRAIPSLPAGLISASSKSDRDFCSLATQTPSNSCTQAALPIILPQRLQLAALAATAIPKQYQRHAARLGEQASTRRCSFHAFASS